VDCQCGIKGRAVSIDTRKLEIDLRSGISSEDDKSVITGHTISRRAALAGATALGASLWLGQLARAENTGGTVSFPIKEYDIATNGISLHVTEQGDGPVVLFCHGFPDTAYTWRRQMKAIAAAGYRAIAPDMRGYGHSSAPVDANLYTPLYSAGDLVGLLDALKIPSAVLVGQTGVQLMRGMRRCCVLVDSKPRSA
jgi:alpha/beta hydrolase fold